MVIRNAARTGVDAACAAALSLPIAVPAAAAEPVTLVADELVGPLQVEVAPNGALFVAEAFAAQVTRIDKQGRRSVPAGGLGDFSPGIGVHGGQVFVTLSSDPHDGDPDGASSLVRISQGGQVREIADQVTANGTISTLTVLPVDTSGDCATLPNNTESGFGCDPVPTGIVLGRDGLLYVSGLGAEVEGHVWQIDPRSGDILQTWSDLPPLTGIAIAPDGTLLRQLAVHRRGAAAGAGHPGGHRLGVAARTGGLDDRPDRPHVGRRGALRDQRLHGRAVPGEPERLQRDLRSSRTSDGPAPRRRSGAVFVLWVRR